jgi:DNA invertase Pin-like site-specific DNA recombinase
MARPLNRGAESAALSKTQRWDLGEYVRLSKEDAQKVRKNEDDSNSIKNQLRILDEYHRNNNGEFSSVTRYVDDGYTGTDTNREGFQRLLSDIHNGLINCVIVKDLSRLSRNYTDAGALIDNLFVQMNVRFISLHERIDSHKDPHSVSSLIVPITNVMNDQYCYQTSRKIRDVFDYKRRNGEFIGSFAPFGYAKDPQDTHRLIVDGEAAGVVRQIYTMFLDGMSKHGITQRLNAQGVISPAEYKRRNGVKYVGKSTGFDPLWTAPGVDGILRNQVYTGDMVQGRHRKKSYKIHVVEKVAQEEWFIVENTHEAIISREVYGRAQEILKRDTRTAPKKNQLYLFSGFLKCADCGKAMARSEVKGNVYYRCTTYASQSKTACTIHSIKHYNLEAAVLYALQKHIHLAASYSALVAMINSAPERKSQAAKMNMAVLAREKELAKIVRYKQSVYEDWKDGEISREDYRNMANDYEEQAGRLREVISNLKAERDKVENGIDTDNPFLATFRKHEGIDKLTREILVELVDHVRVYDGGDVAVRFKYGSDLQLVTEYIEANAVTQETKKAG